MAFSDYPDDWPGFPESVNMLRAEGQSDGQSDQDVTDSAPQPTDEPIGPVSSCQAKED